MLNEKGFNMWADDYDKSVQISDDNDEYPFAGYKTILNAIYSRIMNKPNSKVLDVGIGTGVLSKKLYDNNHSIIGIDFSERMIGISKEKMPDAALIKCDFSKGIPPNIKNYKFDFIVFTYSIHHMIDSVKADLINSLKGNLSTDGKIIIGDVSFENSNDQKVCQTRFCDIWDYDEYYYSYDDLKDKLDYSKTAYEQISICGGIMTISC